LLLTLAESIANELELNSPSHQTWNPKLSPNINFDRYFRREVFVKVSSPIVWCMDNVDRLFACDYGSEVFALFRSWHNNRALDPESEWSRLTMALAYATEAHLFIPDANRSPFNVGTRLYLEDFNLQQTSELNGRYDSPLHNESEIDRFFKLVGGHPYLTSCGLVAMKEQRLSLDVLERQAECDEGLFSDHLRRMLDRIIRDESLCEAIRSVLHGQPCPDAECFYKLRSGGLITGNSLSNAKLRCQLYARYLERNLL
jgi:AAA domain-containing protein